MLLPSEWPQLLFLQFLPQSNDENWERIYTDYDPSIAGSYLFPLYGRTPGD